MTAYDPLRAASLGSAWILRAPAAEAHARALTLCRARGARARPLVESVSPDALRALEVAAAATAFPSRESLVAYAGVDARGLPPPAREALARLLLAARDVELVEVVPDGLAEPPGTRGDPPPTPPSFLPGDRAPAGLGLRHAHAERGCRGAGVRLGIVEQGWDLSSPLLPTNRIRLLCNDVRGHRRHGAGVLAVLCAATDGEGRCGLAPELDGVLVAGEGARAWPGLDLAADAIVAAAAALGPGDVLLLETQREEGGRAWPAEVSQPILHAIRLAASRGIVVVEAAGNGGGDLDAFTAADGRRPFAVGDPAFVDSGAVLVGACEGGPRWELGAGATRGERLDVVAPGDGVGIPGGGAAGEGGLSGPDEGPTGEGLAPVLTGTSAAAALVAGCVALVQSARLASGEPPLAPLELRDRLRDPGRGTAVVGTARTCPDLERLLGA